MTAARSPLSLETLMARAGHALREGARWFLRGVLALAIIVMAGMFAVVTAAVGLIIAAVAILLRLTTGGARGGAKPGPRPGSAKTEADGITLDAHRTARGWTVE